MKARIPKNIGGGGAQNMNQMIKQAQKMQDEITALQEDIEARDFTATAGGGAVDQRYQRGCQQHRDYYRG